MENVFKKYSGHIEINLGIHATMLSRLFGKQISKYYAENKNIKINVINDDLENMLSKLEKQELDIVITKRMLDYENKKIEFISLGKLQDVLVVNPASKLIGKVLNLETLKEESLYMPRKTSLTTINFLSSTNSKEEDFCNIKNITYNTMLEIIKNTDSIGLMTREYVENEINNKQIVVLKTDFIIDSIEYGIYINKENKFKALTSFINVIKK